MILLSLFGPGNDNSMRVSVTWLRLLGVWLAIFAVFGLGVEGVSRLIFPYVAPSGWDYRSERPVAYQSSPFFSQAFIDEAFSHQNWINLPNTRIIYPGDYHGHWFNVQDGIRRTAEPPVTDRRILLVGSSTIYNAEVPDEFTIASYLQRLIRARSDVEFSVVNLGASGVKVSQQLERLQMLEMRPGDIVLFYDGTADAMQGVFYANFDGWIVGENRKRLDNIIARNRVGIEALARRSRFFNWLYARTTNYLPEHLKHPEQVRALSLDSRDKLLRGLLETDRYVSGKSGTFIHVLQPDLFSRPLREFERPLVENHFLTMNGIELALRVAHEEFEPLTRLLAGQGVKAYDASMLFNAVDAPVFLDFAHTNEVGNKVIADFLFRILVAERILTER